MTPLTINLTRELYNQLPEDTIREKILKQRLSRNIERKDFCNVLNAEKKTVELWELHGLVPTAKICDLFKLPLEYFSEYYSLYFKHPEDLFLEWNNKNGYSYSDCVRMLECSRSALLSFTNGRFGFLINMYLKMKKVGVF